MRLLLRMNRRAGSGANENDKCCRRDGEETRLEFIKVGSTTRGEVEQKLGWVDTGIKDDRLFIGRWAESSWGVAWAAGGGYSAAGGCSQRRAWSLYPFSSIFAQFLAGGKQISIYTRLCLPCWQRMLTGLSRRESFTTRAESSTF